MSPSTVRIPSGNQASGAANIILRMSLRTENQISLEAHGVLAARRSNKRASNGAGVKKATRQFVLLRSLIRPCIASLHFKSTLRPDVLCARSCSRAPLLACWRAGLLAGWLAATPEPAAQRLGPWLDAWLAELARKKSRANFPHA